MKKIINGFTLIELILFIVVMSIVVAGLVPMYTETLKGQNAIREQTQAAGVFMELRETVLGDCRVNGLIEINSTTYPSTPVVVPMGPITFQRIITSIEGANASGGCTGSGYQVTSDPKDVGKCLKVEINDNSTGSRMFSENIMVFAGPPEDQFCP